jgi:pyruvate kinase
MKRERRARIVATLGPASSSPEMIRKLFDAGVDVFRLNFSHGSHDDHRERYDVIRSVEKEVGQPIAILQDLQGPKIRLGMVNGGRMMLEKGEIVRFVLAKETKEAHTLPLPHKEIFDAVMPKHHLLIDDGKVRLQVERITDTAIEARVLNGGPVTDRKGVNLPDTILDLSPITAKDREDLAFGLELGVDWVAFSFVQRPSDLIEAHALVGGRAGVLAKIEKPSALASMEELVRLADAIMVARGDLGVEIPPEDVPGAQKDLVRACRMAGKPVIIATQMLESMISSPTPTRAEASDVATAIYDGADAVMLSAESASGQYPIEAVEIMDHIIGHTEQHHSYPPLIHALHPPVEPHPQHLIAAAAADVATSIGAAGVVAFTQSGTSAYRIARQRPSVPILTITPSLTTARRLALLWGTQEVQSNGGGSYDEMVAQAIFHARDSGFAKAGDTIVIVSGIPFGTQGSTNNLRIATV